MAIYSITGFPVEDFRSKESKFYNLYENKNELPLYRDKGIRLHHHALCGVFKKEK